MDDLIRRQDAVDVILADKIDDTSLEIMTALGDGRLALTLNDACDRHIQEIEKLPSAQQEPTLEQIEEYCRKRCLSIVDNALLHKYAQAEQQWISCGERLPEMKKPILVTYETEDGLKVDKTMYDRFGFMIGEVTAWMPLPEPYKEKSNEKNL